MENRPMSEMNRREFVQLTTRAAVFAAAAAGVCGLCCESACAADAPAAPGPSGTSAMIVDVGTIADYPTDGVFDKYAKDNQVLVVRKGNQIYAMSAICTHKAKTVRLASGVLT